MTVTEFHALTGYGEFRTLAVDLTGDPENSPVVVSGCVWRGGSSTSVIITGTDNQVVFGFCDIRDIVWMV